MSGQGEKNMDEPVSAESTGYGGITGILNDPDLPEEKRIALTREIMTFQMTAMQITRESEENASAFQNFTPEHITQYLTSSDTNMVLSHKSDTQNRWFKLAVIGMTVGLFGFTIFVLKEKPEYLEKILIGAGGVIAGALGGFGYGKTKKDD